MRKTSNCIVASFLIFVMSASGRAGDDSAAGNQGATREQLEFFEKEVRPLFAAHCYSCHSVQADKLQAGLLMDSRAGLLRGGDSGAAMIPGDVDGSLLIEAVRYESYEMPPKGKLSDEEIATLEQWVEIGAPWPVETAPSAETTTAGFDLQQRKSDHWAWQPVVSPPTPSVSDSQWPRDDIDRFILSRLDATGLKPAADADRSALMRRLYFDLIGLPPTVEQSASFLADTSPRATERLVDDLLNSPHFGERWGRHWLDLVRYAESRGHEFDNDTPNAFQYRDYVIRALNEDVPYDEFVREQIAGDLLPDPRLNPKTGFNESILGTGFWFLGEWVHSPVDIRKDESDRFDNMIDVMSKTFLGITVSCARCHDHKFDAISTADYYSLSGFLESSDYRQVRFESIEQNKSIALQLGKIDKRYRKLIQQQISSKGLGSPAASPLDAGLEKHVVLDYSSIHADEFLQDGFIFGERPRQIGEAYLTYNSQTQASKRELTAPKKRESQKQPKQDRRAAKATPTEADVQTPGIAGKAELMFASSASAASDPFWNGLDSVTESPIQNRNKLVKLPRSGRTLRSPTFTLTDGNVACLVRGAGHVVACVDSHRLVAGPLHGETIRPIKNGEPWIQLKLDRYVGHRLHLEFTPAKNSELEVSLVTQGTTPEIRRQLLRRHRATEESVKQFTEAVHQKMGERVSEIVASWTEERSQLQTQVKLRSHLAMAMLDGTGEEAHVLIRGNSSKPGKIEPRHFLTAVAGNQPLAIESGSGRLELAAQINDLANPLTSRVIVNRIWHYLLGRGLVPTTDDFGVLGQRPTHPELLDHLATRFVNNGQSIKGMIRDIVLSRTYQMTSISNPASVAMDPKNLWWHHRPPKRLEGEAIRDALLSISGKLDATAFGEPVPIHLTEFMDGRGRPGKSGPLDGNGRRSIYVAVRRNFLSPFMTTFDSPTPFSTMGRRNVSNVPAQALILMNDPLVVELAKRWGERAIKTQATMQTRVRWMYQIAYARQPTGREEAMAISFLQSQAERHNIEQSDPQLWADLAHVLINAKEFIFLR